MIFVNNLSLDQLIDLIQSDETIAYGAKEIKRLEAVLAKKVAKIRDSFEKEFYEGVTDQLIFEMRQALDKADTIESVLYSNPLKEEYDNFNDDLINDINQLQLTYEEIEKLCKHISNESSFGDYYSPKFTPQDRNTLSNLKEYVVMVKKDICSNPKKSKYIFNENRQINNFLFKIKE